MIAINDGITTGNEGTKISPAREPQIIGRPVSCRAAMFDGLVKVLGLRARRFRRWRWRSGVGTFPARC
jgi:hypothetical protein